ncbi:hypothetical protein KFK09_028458 [Dendrobium nobile]|uniref:Uncharacterized protein n=1 Tax=Dendrobium nobile TaxID=94219 RepID=A0A8T3A3D6_DENNO|nr:hypothetical protein KFK09_028458 [Dendrobium nobile]
MTFFPYGMEGHLVVPSTDVIFDPPEQIVDVSLTHALSLAPSCGNNVNLVADYVDHSTCVIKNVVEVCEYINCLLNLVVCPRDTPEPNVDVNMGEIAFSDDSEDCDCVSPAGGISLSTRAVGGARVSDELGNYDDVSYGEDSDGGLRGSLVDMPLCFVSNVGMLTHLVRDNAVGYMIGHDNDEAGFLHMPWMAIVWMAQSPCLLRPPIKHTHKYSSPKIGQLEPKSIIIQLPGESPFHPEEHSTKIQRYSAAIRCYGETKAALAHAEHALAAARAAAELSKVKLFTQKVPNKDGSIPMLAKDPPLSNPTNISSPKIGQLEPKEHNNPASIRESPFSTPKNIAPKSSDIQRPSDAMERAKAALATAEHALAAARAAAELSKVKLFTQESPKQSD